MIPIDEKQLLKEEAEFRRRAKEIREGKILSAYRQGMDTSDVARKFLVTQRHVFNLLHRNGVELRKYAREVGASYSDRSRSSAAPKRTNASQGQS